VGGKHGFERSMAGDGVQSVRTSSSSLLTMALLTMALVTTAIPTIQVRTSSTSWCSPGACQSDPTMQLIRERIANLTMAAAACGKRPLGGASPRHTLRLSWGWGGWLWLALVSVSHSGGASDPREAR